MKLAMLKNEVATIRTALLALEAAIAKTEAKNAKKNGGSALPALPATPDASESDDASVSEKPKPERATNAWLVFTKRVDDLLKANSEPLKAPESKQFASSLKNKKAYAEWVDEEILAERKTWVKPEKPEKPETSGKEITAAVEKIMEEITSDSDSASESGKPKKRGRPSKKTE